MAANDGLILIISALARRPVTREGDRPCFVKVARSEAASEARPLSSVQAADYFGAYRLLTLPHVECATGNVRAVIRTA